METHKRASYPGGRVTPAMVETHGRLGKTLLSFIRSAYAGLGDSDRISAVRRALPAQTSKQNARVGVMTSPSRLKHQDEEGGDGAEG